MDTETILKLLSHPKQFVCRFGALLVNPDSVELSKHWIIFVFLGLNIYIHLTISGFQVSDEEAMCMEQ